MKREEEFRLDSAFRDTPEECRQAVLKAVSAYREEDKMKRPLILIAAIVLTLALLFGTALALVSYYSVRDSVAGGAPSQAFEENIIPLGNSQTAQGLTVTLGDAVFDGSHLDFTVQLAAPEDAQPLLLVPALSGSCPGQPLDIDYHAGHLAALTDGFLYPSTSEAHPARDTFTVSAEYDGDEPVGTVEWQYTLHLLRPKWEIVQAAPIYGWQVYEAAFLQAWRQGKIMVVDGQSVTAYADAIADSVITDDHRFNGPFLLEVLLGSGAFEEVDVLTFTFSTAVPQVRQMKGNSVFSFDGYQVRVKKITTSFMRVNYALEILLERPFGEEYSLDFTYDVYDQNGEALPWKSSMQSYSPDRSTVTASGSVEYISDAPLTALQFKPSADFCIDRTLHDNEALWFTVDLQ